jgi:hypothetical protein
VTLEEVKWHTKVTLHSRRGEDLKPQALELEQKTATVKYTPASKITEERGPHTRERGHNTQQQVL